MRPSGQPCIHCDNKNVTLLMWEKRRLIFGCYECNKTVEVVRGPHNEHIVKAFEGPKKALTADDFVKNIG